MWPHRSGRTPAPRAGHTAVMVRHHMFVYGGTSEGGAVLTDVQSYNTRSKQWSKLAMVGMGPGGLYSHTAMQHPFYPGLMYARRLTNCRTCDN